MNAVALAPTAPSTLDHRLAALGQRMSDMRRDAGLSRQDIKQLCTKASGEEYTLSHIGNIESGHTNFTVRFLLDFADAVDVPVSQLFQDDDAAERQNLIERFASAYAKTLGLPLDAMLAVAAATAD